MPKTNKSLTKRLRMTRTGKIMAGRPGKNHFNAKESRSAQLAGKRTSQVRLKNKLISRFLPNIKQRS